MPPIVPIEPIYISNFSIGLWSNRSPFSLPGNNPSALLDGLNCEITPQHTVKRRAGFSSLLSTTLAVEETAQRFFSFRQLDGTLRLIVDATATLRAVAVAANTITTFYTPTTTSTPFSFAPVGSMLYFANGKTGEEQKWDGTNQTRWGIVAPTDTPTTAFASTSVLGATYDNTQGTNWTTQANAKLSDDAYAIYNTTTQDRLGAFKYNFSLPASSTILGIEVLIEGNGDSATVANREVQVALSKSASDEFGDKLLTLNQTTDTVQTLGSSTDLWSTTWTQAEIESDTFGVRLWDDDTTAAGLNIDHIQIRVYHTTGSGITAVRGYQYRFVYKNSTTGHISEASAASLSTDPITNKQVEITGNFSSDSQVDQIEVYRNADGGGVFFKVDTLTNPGSGTWTYTDTTADSSLGTLKAPITGLNSPPTDSLDNVVFHSGRMWGSVDNIVYYSGGGEILNGVPEEAWSALNFFNFPGKVTALFPFSIGLLVFTESSLFVIRGVDRTSFFAMPWQTRLGIKSNRALTGTEDRIFIFTSERELMSISADEIREIGVPIAGDLAAIDPADVELTLHRDEATDNNLYVSDGANQYYRLSLGDEIWSPKALVTNGLKTLGSVETTVGNFNLLLGRPVGTDVILKRDSTLNTDNGTAYAMNMSFGSFVIAPPATLREVEAIVLERSSGNTDYSVGVRLNEVGLEYKLLLSKTPDPPLLGSSTTARSLSYYVGEMARHLQVRLFLPAEDTDTQLYSLTLVVK